ncbi:MAG: hypothetical protein H0X18_01550 [Geodermatophilaceae bacterium]|nr:hypothetical protein [Geodermatophilaceae bacterium]
MPGADRVARFVLGIVSRIDPGDEVDVMLVNGDPGIVVRRRQLLPLAPVA